MNKTLGKGLGLNIVPVVAAFCLLLTLMLVACGDATTAPAANATTSPAMTTSGSGTTMAAGTTAAATTSTAGGTTAAATTGSGATPQGWNQLNSAEGKFSILMPGNPQKESQTADAAGSNITVNIYQVTQSDQNNQVVYNASYTDYPAALIQSTDPTKILQEVIAAQTKGLQGVSQDEKAITLGSVQGRQNTFKFSRDSGVSGDGMGRAYLTGNRVYQLMVAYPDGKKPADSDIAAFFDSFKITS